VRLAEQIKRSPRVFIIGNGGSYANAGHMANDLQSCGVDASTLNCATLTAWANDHGYETVFSRWIETAGRPGDLLIALSGSGKSPNILRALEAAKRKGMGTYAVIGAWQSEEPPACALADTVLRLGTDMQDAEEWQLRIGHEAMKALARAA
jgi:D-sedoheptulose 7-phosphate isomerase